jgi:hypothetical protein
MNKNKCTSCKNCDCNEGEKCERTTNELYNFKERVEADQKIDSQQHGFRPVDLYDLNTTLFQGNSFYFYQKL